MKCYIDVSLPSVSIISKLKPAIRNFLSLGTGGKGAWWLKRIMAILEKQKQGPTKVQGQLGWVKSDNLGQFLYF